MNCDHDTDHPYTFRGQSLCHDCYTRDVLAAIKEIDTEVDALMARTLSTINPKNSSLPVPGMGAN